MLPGRNGVRTSTAVAGKTAASGAETTTMTTDVVSTTLRPGLARPPFLRAAGLEHVVMGGAIVALIVLVVLPLLSLLLGSVQGEQGLSLDHFERGAVRPALRQGAEELADPRRLDRAVQPRHRPAARLGGEPHRRAGQAADPAHRHAVLPLAAVPHRHRFHLPVQPQCRADQRADARRAGPAVAHLQHLLDGRAWCW